jgi:hypothetical protein
MNKDLYGHKVSIPEEVIEYLSQCFESAKGANETTEGYNRNQDLRNNKEITYQQLKRIKHWFDNFKGEPNDLSYILNGGDYVKNWVNGTLDSLRDSVYSLKKNRSEVLPNQFLKTHEKNGLTNLNRPSKGHVKSSEYYNLQVTESLKRINELIKKII